VLKTSHKVNVNTRLSSKTQSSDRESHVNILVYFMLRNLMVRRFYPCTQLHPWVGSGVGTARLCYQISKKLLKICQKVAPKFRKVAQKVSQSEKSCSKVALMFLILIISLQALHRNCPFSLTKC
jgi:hypothetical protein